MNNAYDLIGDIHGHADRLTAMLETLGYENNNGIYAHPSRKVVFMGDFIDRGPKIRETLEIVRPMIDNGHALAVMGNHEFNAIAYTIPKPDGGFLRDHRPERVRQHEETLRAFAGDEKAWKGYLEWFRGLPLFLDAGNIRIVHACWDEDNIKFLKEQHGGMLNDRLLNDSHDKGKPEYKVIDEVLKGRELHLPEGVTFHDKDGHPRRKARIRWWNSPMGMHYTDYLMGPGPGLEIDIATSEDTGYPAAAPPVFFGHYWLPDSNPSLMAPNAACLDYSVAKGGFLCAYRWDGEQTLSKDRFVKA